jgi:hypothetical protein
MSKDPPRSRKRRISHISQGAENRPPSLHEKVKLGKRRQYVASKGLRIEDRPQKRVALATIARNNQRPSKEVIVRTGCKQCQVYLCSTGLCWQTFHQN